MLYIPNASTLPDGGFRIITLIKHQVIMDFALPTSMDL